MLSNKRIFWYFIAKRILCLCLIALPLAGVNVLFTNTYNNYVQTQIEEANLQEKQDNMPSNNGVLKEIFEAIAKSSDQPLAYMGRIQFCTDNFRFLDERKKQTAKHSEKRILEVGKTENILSIKTLITTILPLTKVALIYFIILFTAIEIMGIIIACFSFYTKNNVYPTTIFSYKLSKKIRTLYIDIIKYKGDDNNEQNKIYEISQR